MLCRSIVRTIGTTIRCRGAVQLRMGSEKAASNLKDHGVSFDEAITVFGDILAMNMPDPDHSEGEKRFLVLGMSKASSLVVVSYAERPPRSRIISARLATSRERRKYEND